MRHAGTAGGHSAWLALLHWMVALVLLWHVAVVTSDSVTGAVAGLCVSLMQHAGVVCVCVWCVLRDVWVSCVAGPSTAKRGGRPTPAGTAQAAQIEELEMKMFSNTRRRSVRQTVRRGTNGAGRRAPGFLCCGHGTVLVCEPTCADTASTLPLDPQPAATACLCRSTDQESCLLCAALLLCCRSLNNPSFSRGDSPGLVPNSTQGKKGSSRLAKRKAAA